MTETSAIPSDSPALAERVLDAVDRHVVGQRPAAELLLATYMAGGHALLEGAPGIGKTLLARTLAAVLGLDFQRVQFTPDLMPTDVTGTNVFDPQSRDFQLLRGPVFTQILMADEINRTPPKTQSALLEAMQEQQVTIDGVRHPLDPAFFVVATQNPLEFEGTYPLPEAQLDRFLARVDMGLPAPADEIELFRRAVARPGGPDAAPALGELPSRAALDPSEATALRRAASTVHVGDDLLEYLGRLVAAVRAERSLELAPSPRGALALLATARATAIIEGRDFLIPDDLKRCLLPCWRHRSLLDAEAELEGHTVTELLERVAATVPSPKRSASAQPDAAG